MTKMFVRLLRNGTYQSLEIDELTDVEMRQFFVGRHEQELVQWACTLAAWIRDNVQQEDG